METIALGDVLVSVQRKQVKHVHLSVKPPEGEVVLVAPPDLRMPVLRAYVLTRSDWIAKHRERMRQQTRETARAMKTRETHMVWGRPCLLNIQEGKRGRVQLDFDVLNITARAGSTSEQHMASLHRWYRQQLHAEIPAIIAEWEQQLGVKVQGYRLQRMKTRWASCETEKGTLLVNTEMAKKPKHLLHYVIGQTLISLVEPNKNKRYMALLEKHIPMWKGFQQELNRLPVGV